MLSPYQARLWVSLALILVASAAGLVQPRIIQFSIDRGLVEGHLDELNLWALAYVATLVIGWLASYWQTWLLSWVGQRILFTLRTRMFDHLQKLSLRYYDRERIGHIISRNTSDVSAVNEVLTQGLLQSIADAFTLVGTVALMLTMSVRLTLVTMIVLPVMYFLARWFATGSRPAYRRIRQSVSAVNAMLAENIVGMRLVQAFRREDRNFDEFDVINKENVRAQKDAIFFHAGVMPILDLVDAGVTGLLLFVGGHWILGGDAPELSIGVLTAFMLYSARFFEPMRDLAARWDQVQAALAAGERIFHLLDLEPDVKERPGANPMPAINGVVRFEEVTFGYDPARPILHDITFTAEPGQTVALVGHTGSGKSTIVNLAGKFHLPTRGVVRVDGRDLATVTGSSLHRQMGLVPQQNHLFSGTVLDNLRLGRPGATEREVLAAAEALGCRDLFEALPLGLATEVGERGAALSVGQRQLICFTRALLADPRLVVLDEATSAIDAVTEARLQEALVRLLRGRTSFIVAHRLSTIRHAHLVLVLDQGRIIERGTHPELVRAGGSYAALYRQFVQVDAAE